MPCGVPQCAFRRVFETSVRDRAGPQTESNGRRYRCKSNRSIVSCCTDARSYRFCNVPMAKVGEILCLNSVCRVPRGFSRRKLTRLLSVSPLKAISKDHPSRSAIDEREEDNGVPTKVDLKVAVFSAQQYVRDFLEPAMTRAFTDVHFIESRLSEQTVRLAEGFDAVCLFVNDEASGPVLEALAEYGVKAISMRCAGYDKVDLSAAERLGIPVVRVPTYSPRTVAEMALTMMMASARSLPPAIRKVAVGNYTLNGLVGREISGKNYGIVGTGNIGTELIKLLNGFDGHVLAYDIRESDEAKSAGATYVDFETLLRESDVVSLHTPLLPSTRHIMNKERLLMMKPSAMLINVSRGALIDTEALMEVLQSGHLCTVALDVYEGEESLFFEDFTRYSSKERMKYWDWKWKMLESLPQVLVTPHIAFLTHEALENIAQVTVDNLRAVARGDELQNEVKRL